MTKASASDSKEGSMVDVAHPGKTAPSGTSRPVIVGNRPVLQDPMVNADDGKTAPELMNHTSKVSKVKTLEPSEQAETKSNIDKQPDIKEEAESKNQAEPTTEPDQPKTETAKESNVAAEKALDQHEAEIQKMVDSKRYNLPINSLEKRRTKHTLIIGIVLSILLLLAWVNIAMDAGLIEINGVKPLTHFFST